VKAGIANNQRYLKKGKREGTIVDADGRMTPCLRGKNLSFKQFRENEVGWGSIGGKDWPYVIGFLLGEWTTVQGGGGFLLSDQKRRGVEL